MLCDFVRSVAAEEKRKLPPRTHSGMLQLVRAIVKSDPSGAIRDEACTCMWIGEIVALDRLVGRSFGCVRVV